MVAKSKKIIAYKISISKTGQWSVFMSKKYLGSLGEKIALKYYLTNNFVLLAKNYFTRYGELDLIMSKDNIYYAIEVKTRTNHKYGFAEEMINNNKIDKMHKTAYLFAPQADWHLEIIVIDMYGKQAKIQRFAIYDY